MDCLVFSMGDRLIQLKLAGNVILFEHDRRNDVFLSMLGNYIASA